MRSPNTAYKLGREIGHQVDDVWIPDEVLRSHIRRSIRPKIKLFKSDADRSAESSNGIAGLMAALTSLAVILALPLAVPPTMLESLAPLVTYRASVEQLVQDVPTAMIIGFFVLLIATTVVCFIVAAAARKRASATYKATVGKLYAAAFDGATAVLEGRRRKVGMSVEPSRTRSFLPPSPRPHGVDARGAEEIAAQWMRHLGEADAELTSVTGDGGIDVTGARSFAQVKHYSKAVGVAAVRDLAGVSAHDPRRRQPLFFTSVGYSRGAVDFADSAGIALFVYDAERGGLDAMNARAKTLVHNGIS